MTSTPTTNDASNGLGNTPTRSRVLHSFHFEDLIRYVFEDDTHSPQEGTAVDRFVQESIETNCAKWTKEDRDKPFKRKIEDESLSFQNKLTREQIDVLENMSRQCGRRLRVLWLDVESLKRDFRNERERVFRFGEYSIIPRFLERSILRLRVVFLGACALLLESKIVERILCERRATMIEDEEEERSRTRSNSIRDAAVASARRRSKSTTEINFQTLIRKHESIEGTRNELNETYSTLRKLERQTPSVRVALQRSRDASESERHIMIREMSRLDIDSADSEIFDRMQLQWDSLLVDERNEFGKRLREMMTKMIPTPKNPLPLEPHKILELVARYAWFVARTSGIVRAKRRDLLPKNDRITYARAALKDAALEDAVWKRLRRVETLVENLLYPRLRHITWGDRYGVLTDACGYLDRVWYDRVMPFALRQDLKEYKLPENTNLDSLHQAANRLSELDTCRVPCRVVRILELCVLELSHAIEEGQHLSGDAMFPLLAFCLSRSNLRCPHRVLFFANYFVAQNSISCAVELARAHTQAQYIITVLNASLSWHMSTCLSPSQMVSLEWPDRVFGADNDDENKENSIKSWEASYSYLYK